MASAVSWIFLPWLLYERLGKILKQLKRNEVELERIASNTWHGPKGSASESAVKYKIPK